MKTHILVLLLFIPLLAMSFAVAAQETSGDFSTGSIMIGYDNQACVTGLTGAMRYNSSNGIEFCDSTQWTSTGNTPAECGGGGGCTAPSLCPNIGDVCDDSDGGTTNDPIFAGFILYQDPNSADVGECKPLYVTNNNQSTSSQWKPGSGDDIATDSTEDGKINDSQVANSTTFPSFKLCKDLTDGGYTDWYLPARDELHLLWKHKTAIDANAAGNFTTSQYWSSTEGITDYAWYQPFGSGGQGSVFKTVSYDVRCVRRD